ncbi:MAG: T9SS type A sorting domain-containing protein [Bacteroidia bacterium]|nr:T9SS type A sorting domain-containing protein [Bacteroidia bacterium]
MKKIFTFIKGFNRPSVTRGSLIVILSAALFFVGCYEWRNIFQPETVAINSFFDVWLSAQDDGNPDNDWTNPDLHDIGLFGVMLPIGWDVQDSVTYFIKTTEAGYDNNGILLYNAAHSQTLTDSIPPAPGYYWWGAKTDGEASMIFFDSLYIQPRIFTDDQVGTFYLRYAIGDEDYWDRNPADDVSDPIPITTFSVGLEYLPGTADISIFPNPASSQLHVYFNHDQNHAAEMSIIDLTGKTVLTGQFLNKQNTIRLDKFAKGVYFLRLQTGSESSIHKFVVQ